MSLPRRAARSLSRHHRALAVLVAGLVPWLVIPYESGLGLVFSVTLANTEPLALTSVYHYVFVYTRGLPAEHLAWPTATMLYGMGVASGLLSLVGREDRRVTAGLFALAAFDVCYAVLGFSSFQVGTVAYPLGAVFLAVAAWASRP